MTHTFCWADIPVLDFNRAIDFYSAILGTTVEHQSPGTGFEYGVLPGSTEGVSACLCHSEDNKPSDKGPLIYLSVEGRLDAALQAVPEKGGRVIKEKHPIGSYGYRALILDSEGNRLALHSRAG